MAKLSGTFLIKIVLKFSLKLYKKKIWEFFLIENFNLKFDFCFVFKSNHQCEPEKQSWGV